MNSLVISLINCRYSKFLCTFPLNSFIDELSRANMSVQLNQQTQSQGFQEVHYLSGTCKSAQKLQGKTSTNKWKTSSFHGKPSWWILATLLICVPSHFQRTYHANSSPTDLGRCCSFFLERFHAHSHSCIPPTPFPQAVMWLTPWIHSDLSPYLSFFFNHLSLP